MICRWTQHWMLCGSVLAIACVVAGNAGCVGLAGLDGDLLSSLGIAPNLLADDGGNVVISCGNATKSPVQWRLAWQRSGSDEASTLAVTIGPGETKALSVTGTVERIAAGSLTGWSVAAVIDPTGADPHTASYGGAPLEKDVDFQSGDIIRYDISESGGGRYLISAEIACGG